MSLSPDTESTLRLIHRAALSKQAREPVALDVTGLCGFTDALYVCHGDSTRAVQAILDALLEALREGGVTARHVEGRSSLQWVLVDLGDVMVHIFLKDRRGYYDLERLWADAPQVVFEAA